MLLNSKIATDLFDAWSNDQNHPHRGRASRVIPTVQEFEIFLDTLFQTSLLQEEGVPISTSVAWISKEDYYKFEIPMWRQTELCLQFDSPINFEAKNLAKMNGIANGNSSTLLAHGFDNNFYIWGICYFDIEHEVIGAIPVQDMCTRHFAPDCPTITISGVGSLQITRRDSVIGRVESGKFISTHPDVLVVPDMLGKYLYRLIGIEIDFKSYKFKDDKEAIVARTYMSCVEYLIELLAIRKFGATIVLLPEKVTVESLFDCSWSVTGSLEINVLQEKKILYFNAKNPSGSLFELKISRSLRNRLRNVSDLAKMDGALLLTPKFEIVGFGVKLKSPKWEGDIQCGPNPYSTTKQTLDFSRLGTRHNSALNFVGSVGGAIAFVSSSDGPIRALTKDDEGRVVYWPDCRISMFK